MTLTEPLMIKGRLALSVHDHVAEVRLARSERMNALDELMFAALAECLALLNASDAHVVIVSGEGRAFCAGLDMAMFEPMVKGDRPGGIPADLTLRTHGLANLPQHVAMGWRALPMPVIAAVHGAAFGGGLQLMLGADIRVVSPDVRLALREIQWGLVPDMGAFALLPALVRDDRLRLSLYTGQEIDGARAMSWGLATELAEDPLDAAREMARQIAAASPAAIRAAKRLANAAMPDSRNLLLLESAEQQRLIGGEDQRKAIASRSSNAANAADGDRIFSDGAYVGGCHG